MNPASVGFQCPACAGVGRRSRPAAASGRRSGTFGASVSASLRRGRAPATVTLMALLAVEWLLDLLSRGLADGLLVMSNEAVALGQYWRLVTGTLTSGSILGLLMVLLVLWMAGRALEADLGGARFIALFAIAGLGGATLLMVVAPMGSYGYGASAAVLGLLGANAVFKHKAREDVRPDIGLFVLLVLYGVLVGYATYGWVMLIGGIGAGSLAAAAIAYVPGGRRAPAQVAALALVAGLCVAAVAARLTLG